MVDDRHRRGVTVGAQRRATGGNERVVVARVLGGTLWLTLTGEPMILTFRKELQEPHMPTGTMTSKGQITIPKMVREALGLLEGTKVDFELLPDGAALMRVKRTSIMSLFGKYSTGGIKVSIEEMDPRSLDIFK